MDFVVSSPFLSIILTTFVIGTEKVLYFPVFSPTRIDSPLNSFASSFMIKW